MEAEFYNIKTRLYLGLFSVKILLLPSFALAAIWLSNLGLLHERKRAHCVGLVSTKMEIADESRAF